MENTQKLANLHPVARGNVHINREPQANSSKKSNCLLLLPRATPMML